MDRKTADRLVARLGMTDDLAPLLDSDEAYQRFEKAVSDVLISLAGKRQLIRDTGRYDCRCHDFVFESIGNIDLAITCFRRYYGIGRAEQNKHDIARDLNLGEKKGREENSKESSVIKRVWFIKEVLRQYHKKAIWYATL
jgi:hypothetical protein